MAHYIQAGKKHTGAMRNGNCSELRSKIRVGHGIRGSPSRSRIVCGPRIALVGRAKVDRTVAIGGHKGAAQQTIAAAQDIIAVESGTALHPMRVRWPAENSP